MNQEATNTMFKALEDDDFNSFSKAVKSEIDRKVKEHPLTIRHQDEFDKFKGIEALYAKVKVSANPS
jgi:hypothetical protein